MRRPSDLQITYQRNLLCGLLGSILLAGSVAVWLLFSGESGTYTIPAGDWYPVDLSHPHIDDDTCLHQGGRSKFGNGARSRSGFLGFRSVRPIHDRPPVVTGREAPRYTFESALPPLDEISFGSSISYEDSDVGAERYDAAPLVDAMSPHPANAPVNRDVEVVYHVDPEYPWVAREAGKEGTLVVLLYIDSLGEPSVFPDWIAGKVHDMTLTLDGRVRTVQYALRENPPGWYFAQNFLRVLPQWRFAPRIENGRPVGALLRVIYRFCLGVNCIKYEATDLSTSG